MKVILVDFTDEPELTIEMAARTSTRSWVEMNEREANKKLLRYLIDHEHFSAIEHAHFTFLIKGISRSCSHQLVRHRMASYTQSSQRYVEENDFKYTIPESIKKNKINLQLFYNIMRICRNTYNQLIDFGVPKEDARFVLPNAVNTDILMTANLREWRHIFLLRGSKESQWEIRELTIEIFKIMKPLLPNLLYDLEISKGEIKKCR